MFDDIIVALGDGMLKNAREYLEQEKEKVSNHIVLLEENLENLKKTKAEARALVDSYNITLTGQQKIFMDLINDFLKSAVGYTLISVISVSVPIISTISLILMVIAYFAHLGVNIFKYKTAKSLYEDILGNLETFNPEDYNGVYDIELNLCSIAITKIDNIVRKLDRETQYLNAINNILTSECFNDKELKYFKECENFKIVLEKEWENYLEEISRLNPGSVALTTAEISEECYKDSVKKLHYVPDKLDKSENN